MRVAQYTENKTFSTRPVTYTSPYTFTTGNDIYFVKLSGGTADSNVQLKPAVGSISEKIVNKNLFDINTIIRGYELNSNTGNDQENANWWLSDYIVIKPNTTYISSNISSSTKCWYDSDKNFISRVQAITGTSPANAKYLRVNGTLASLQTNPNLQIEQGLTATTYTAHQEQTYTIPVQQPMRSIGQVRDEFIQVNGVWKERHNIGIVTIDGNVVWTKNTSYANVFNKDNFLSDRKFGTNVLLCDHFTFGGVLAGSSANVQVGKIYLWNTESLKGRIVIGINADTKEEVSTYFQNNNTDLLYILETPQDLPCTEEQIAILETLPTSYNEQTNIYSLDVTPAYIEAKALKGE